VKVSPVSETLHMEGCPKVLVYPMYTQRRSSTDQPLCLSTISASALVLRLRRPSDMWIPALAITSQCQGLLHRPQAPLPPGTTSLKRLTNAESENPRTTGCSDTVSIHASVQIDYDVDRRHDDLRCDEHDHCHPHR